MNRSELEIAASALTMPAPQACREYAAKGSLLADRVTKRIAPTCHLLPGRTA
jgi:hypothetical protein